MKLNIIRFFVIMLVIMSCKQEAKDKEAKDKEAFGAHYGNPRDSGVPSMSNISWGFPEDMYNYYLRPKAYRHRPHDKVTKDKGKANGKTHSKKHEARGGTTTMILRIRELMHLRSLMLRRITVNMS